MDYKEAINASQIWAARGYDRESGECVVSVSHYGDELRWLEGWGGNWKKTWKPVPEDEMHKLDDLEFRPYGAKDDDQIAQEMLDALSEIADEYEHEKEVGADYFEPMGETYE